jgi:hypothetical protein
VVDALSVLSRARSRDTFGTSLGSGILRPIQHVGGLPVGQLAPQIAVLGHADREGPSWSLIFRIETSLSWRSW